jgi:arylsulfatase A-like enzyme
VTNLGGRKKRCVVVMYDTLCRHFMPAYGNEWVKAPNFDRLAKRSVQFQNYYVGSMPCMPARREMHTGRYNFLHRSWGPLEPFDDSMPEMLHSHGVHSHKVTDHQHYWEDGGATYHQRYSTFEFVRGQEGDKWVGDVEKLRDPNGGEGRWPEHRHSPMHKQDNINREHMVSSDLQPQHKTFSLGLEFIERNVESDNWYLQIETFDPHEPFFTQAEFQDLYPHEYDGPAFDWPPYREVREDDLTVEHIRYMYAALVTYCDQQLGRVLDVFDKHDLWQDTMLIVNTDHGFLMGEHDWWAKVVTPFFQEVAHIPFWAYDPRHPGCIGKKRDSVVQTIDLAPTILDYFDIPVTRDMQGKSLTRTMLNDEPVRKAALYGVMGGQVNVTDGQYVYMRGNVTEDNSPLYEYTLMPTHMKGFFSVRELNKWEKFENFSFTKACPVMQIPSRTPRLLSSRNNPYGKGRTATLLFDVQTDPGQTSPLVDVGLEVRMIKLMLFEMAENECPPEQYVRLGLPEPVRKSTSGLEVVIELPSDELIEMACVLKAQLGLEMAEHGGNGLPKMPFGDISFPDNLRLRSGYVFSQTQDKD